MKTKLAHGIEDAQVKLHEAVRAAVTEFSENTGLTVYAVECGTNVKKSKGSDGHSVDSWLNARIGLEPR